MHCLFKEGEENHQTNRPIKFCEQLENITSVYKLAYMK